jgi:hypothetical protein
MLYLCSIKHKKLKVMKKVRIFTVLLAVAGLVFMNSCKHDEEHAAPTISISHTSWELDFSTDTAVQVLFTADVNAEAEIETFSISETKIDQNGGETSAAYDASTTSSFKGETSKKYTFDKTFYQSDFVEYKEYDYKFSVTDKDGQSYSVTVKITKKETSTTQDATVYSAVLMGAQSNANVGSFYDVENNTVFTLNEANSNQEAVDFVYYYGSTNAATIAAPNDETVNGGSGDFTWTQDWTTQNATAFYKLTDVDFDAIQTTTDVDNALEGQTSPLSKVTQLAVGDVVGFTTVAGTNGVFKVTDISGTSDGTITISVKINVAAN